tara:strand:- start:303 stop:764 length:462 start_codon:yes stop_codon:yes gene_type:complete
MSNSLASLMTWDSSPAETNSFKLITKLTDFGSPDGNKSITGFYINLNIHNSKYEYGVDYTNNSPIYKFSGLSLTFSYRQSTGHQWLPLSSILSDNLTYGTKFHSITFTSPIKGIRTAQIKIEAQGYVKGDISINDLGLIYKKHTDRASSNLDE